MDRMISDEWVRGSAHTTSPTIDGSASTANSVPHRNVIGIMTRLVNTFSDALDFASNPADTPSSANVTQENSTDAISDGLMTISGVRIIPSARRMVLPIRPLSIPITDLPNTMDVVLIGHRTISSKLVWNSLCIMIFCAVDVNPAVIEVMATIPGIA